MTPRVVGLFSVLSAYLTWGLFPLYFKALESLPVLEVLAHRVVWTLPAAALILTVGSRWRGVRKVLRQPRQLGLLLATALLIAVNWGVYLWAVTNHRVLDASLGYFLTPLMGVVLGIVLFRERLRPWQWVAVGLAALGILQVLVREGVFPWVGLAVATSFGFYGALRKLALVDSAAGLFLEAALLTPLALAWLFWMSLAQTPAFLHIGWTTDLLLIGAGVITAAPLMLYVAGAKRLTLSTVGVLFYLVPSLQFLVGWVVFAEPLSAVRLLTFLLIWLGLLVHFVEGRWHERH